MFTIPKSAVARPPMAEPAIRPGITVKGLLQARGIEKAVVSLIFSNIALIGPEVAKFISSVSVLPFLKILQRRIPKKGGHIFKKFRP